jgi:hypothetical protein
MALLEERIECNAGVLFEKLKTSGEYPRLVKILEFLLSKD